MSISAFVSRLTPLVSLVEACSWQWLCNITTHLPIGIVHGNGIQPQSKSMQQEQQEHQEILLANATSNDGMIGWVCRIRV